MNIAVFIKKTTFHEGYGGLETQNRQLCEGLVKAGHSITVFSPQFGLKLETADSNGVRYVFVPCEFRYLLSSSKNSWVNKSLMAFEKSHNENKYDMVIGQSSSALGIIRSKTQLGVKIISIAHGTIISEIKTRFRNIDSVKSLLMLIPDSGYALVNFFTLQREFIHGSDKVIAVSTYVKNALIDETYVADEKITVIHNGVDATKLIPGDTQFKSTGKFRILFVGRIIKEKGAETLVKLFSGGRFGDIVLDVVGDGPLYKKLSKKVSSSGLDDKIIMHGKKPLEDLKKYYTSEDTKFFVFPTRRYEGFPMVLVEAMLCGLPIVAFDLGGVRDAVVHDNTGFLVPADNTELFAEKIQELIDNDEKRKTFGLNAYKTAISQFTIDAMINRYNEVINKELS